MNGHKNTTVIPTLERPRGKAWRVGEVADFTTLSERHLRRMIAAGQLRVVRAGRRVLIPDSEVRRLTEGK